MSVGGNDFPALCIGLAVLRRLMIFIFALDTPFSPLATYLALPILSSSYVIIRQS